MVYLRRYRDWYSGRPRHDDHTALGTLGSEIITTVPQDDNEYTVKRAVKDDVGELFELCANDTWESYERTGHSVNNRDIQELRQEASIYVKHAFSAPSDGRISHLVLKASDSRCKIVASSHYRVDKNSQKCECPLQDHGCCGRYWGVYPDVYPQIWYGPD